MADRDDTTIDMRASVGAILAVADVLRVSHGRTREAEEEIKRLTALLERYEDENAQLRAALAVSKDPCLYCQLPADEMAKCESGFPGCGRADDLMGCPHLGAAMELGPLREALLMAAPFFNGGSSKTGRVIADALAAEFPFRFDDLVRVARTYGLDPEKLWPWREKAGGAEPPSEGAF